MDSSRIIPKALPRTSDGFELLEELGRGGMGIVYRARELSTNRVVALKVLPYSMQDRETAFDRFQREAILAASISDPRCVFVYGAHSIEDSPAIAMELVEGQTLEHVIQRGEKVPVTQAVRWTIELLEGLEAAHRANVLHRDVKPSNCFLGADGHVKVGDFGLSRSIETHIQLTDPGQFIGSPLYASPEQIRGREVDERSDLYSAAATLYALLTGRPCWQGSNVQEVFARILSEPPDEIRGLRKEVPGPLAKIIAKALEKDPARRQQTLQELRDALHPFAQEALPANPARRLGAYLADAAVLAIVNAAITAILLTGMLAGSTPDPLEAQQQGAYYGTLVSFPLTFLYFAVLEGWLGMGLGKWALGLRVQDVVSGEAVWHRVLVRTAVFLLPGAIPYLFLGLTDPNVGYLSLAVHFTLLIPGRRRNGWRFLHEWASGTRTTQTTLPFPHFAKRLVSVERSARPVDPQANILGLYRLEGQLATTNLGAIYSAEDALLNRKVWILAGRVALPLDLHGGPHRPHWLAAFEADGWHCQVLEAPGGDTLTNWRAQQSELPWDVILRLLLEVSEALAGAGAEEHQISQIWIDRNGRVKLLPFAIQEGEAQRMGRTALLGAAARLIIGDRHVLPRDMPGSGDEVLERILGRKHGYETIQNAAAALRDLTKSPVAVTRRQRALQCLLATAGMGSVLTGFLVATLAMQESAEGLPRNFEQRAFVFLFSGIVLTLFFVLVAMLTRGGLLFRVFGMLIRTRRGLRAGIWLYGLRSVIGFVPALALLGIECAMPGQHSLLLSWIGWGVYGLWLIASIVWPYASPADRLLGTRIVPRT